MGLANEAMVAKDDKCEGSRKEELLVPYLVPVVFLRLASSLASSKLALDSVKVQPTSYYFF